jgi:hypothetical protein
MNHDRTPRGWLLDRHRDAGPQLDTLRRAAVASLPLTWSAALRAVFAPHFLFWRTLAAVWVALLAINFTLTHRTGPTIGADIPPGRIAAWIAQLNAHDTLAQIDRFH